MRQAAENDVDPLGQFLGIQIFQVQIESAIERRMHLRDVPVIGTARQRNNLDIRVSDQKSKQFESRVTSRPNNGDANSCVRCHNRIVTDNGPKPSVRAIDIFIASDIGRLR